jgi:hypothetical protein
MHFYLPLKWDFNNAVLAEKTQMNGSFVIVSASFLSVL